MTESSCKYVEEHQLMNLLHKNLYCQCHIDKGVQTTNMLCQELSNAQKKIDELEGRLSSMKISWDSALHGEAENLKAYRELQSKISRLESALKELNKYSLGSCDGVFLNDIIKEALTQESAPPKQKEERG